MIIHTSLSQKLHYIHHYKENEELKKHTKTNQYVYIIRINQSNTMKTTH